MAGKPAVVHEDVVAWFAGRLPDDWFVGPVEMRADRDEIVVVGLLPEPTGVPVGEDHARAAAQSRIAGFREDTRLERMRLADIAQQRWQRHVTWAARCGDVELVFTNASVPVMTRLRFEDRVVLDTLIDSGVARSRSEALAWCVSQVGTHQGEWIDRLREAMTEVERIRSEGP